VIGLCSLSHGGVRSPILSPCVCFSTICSARYRCLEHIRCLGRRPCKPWPRWHAPPRAAAPPRCMAPGTTGASCGRPPSWQQ
jgi:hypothetical protein